MNTRKSKRGPIINNDNVVPEDDDSIGQATPEQRELVTQLFKNLRTFCTQTEFAEAVEKCGISCGKSTLQRWVSNYTKNENCFKKSRHLGPVFALD